MKIEGDAKEIAEFVLNIQNRPEKATETVDLNYVRIPVTSISFENKELNHRWKNGPIEESWIRGMEIWFETRELAIPII